MIINNILFVVIYRLSSNTSRRKNWIAREASIRFRFDFLSLILEGRSVGLFVQSNWNNSQYQGCISGKINVAKLNRYFKKPPGKIN